MLALCIIGWLLSGFLAAWLGYRYNDEGRIDMSCRAVFWFTVLGGLSLTLTTYHLLFLADYLKKPFFKAKESK
jgi:hypothetical protein